MIFIYLILNSLSCIGKMDSIECIMFSCHFCVKIVITLFGKAALLCSTAENTWLLDWKGKIYLVGGKTKIDH